MTPSPDFIDELPAAQAVGVGSTFLPRYRPSPANRTKIVADRDPGCSAGCRLGSRHGVTHYSLTIAQLADQLHPALGLTTLWGYNPAVALGGGAQPQRHLGGIIVAQRGVPIQITFTNALPPKHILPGRHQRQLP